MAVNNSFVFSFEWREREEAETFQDYFMLLFFVEANM